MTIFSVIELIHPKQDNLPQAKDNLIKILLTDAFLLLGALAFLMLVISGLRYILARGNADSMAKARNNIVYSLTGLIIAVLAASIVNFIIDRAG